MMDYPPNYAFINIHTHKTNCDIGEFALLNIFAQDFPDYKMIDQYGYSVGLHPWHVQEYPIDASIKEIEQAAKLDSVIAIGETGLDRAIETPLEIQMRAFIPQLKIAESFKKPVMLHCVRTYSEMIGIRKKNKFSVPWIFHSFTGNLQIAQEVTQHGCFLSFGKFLMNDKSKVPALFTQLPDEFIFLENDDTKLNIEQVYNRACELKGYSLEQMKRITLTNFNRCFFDGKDK